MYNKLKHTLSTSLIFCTMLCCIQCTTNNPALTQCSAGEDCNSLIGGSFTGSESSVDQDCDDIDDATDTDIGDDVRVIYYTDADSDGFGDTQTLALSCTQIDGAVTQAGDTDDNDATTYPGAIEILGDGIDQDGTGSDKYLVSLLAATSSYQMLTTFNSAKQMTQTAYDWGADGTYDEYHFYTYDDNSNIIREDINSDASDSYESYISKTYDTLNRLTATKNYESNDGGANFYLEEDISHTYSSDSLQFSEQVTTTTNYDESGSITDGPDVVTQLFTYETSGDVITAKSIDTNNNSFYDLQYEYDSAGNTIHFYQDFDDDGENEYLTVYTYTVSNKVSSALQYAYDLSAETPYQAIYYTFDEFGTEATLGFDTDFDGVVNTTFTNYTATYNE